MKRRSLLAGAALPVLGCDKPAEIAGGFNGVAFERGHVLRSTAEVASPSRTHRTQVVVVGGGVAGLAAARALRLHGVEDMALLELEDSAGGNSRSGSVGGIACPLGAHYLPVPGDDAADVQDLLEELGLRRRVAGRWVIEERHLCHSPQERLFFNGAWQDGLLPIQGVGAATLAQYRRFALLVAQAARAERWTIPTSAASAGPLQRALKTISFDAYLVQQGLNDPHLRWYLNYCCLDDYGAGTASVSAWAGIHYFASRHGFDIPGLDHDGARGEPHPVLTWGQGNAWLTRALAAPLGDRLATGWLVRRIAAVGGGVEVDALHPASGRTERWQARRCVVALPLFVAARVVQNAPDFLLTAASATRYAPWLVANLHIRAPLHDRPGPAPSWDNMIYAADASTQRAGGLGYVDAMHQSLLPVPGATVLTHYRALGDLPDGRRQLLDQPWSHWRDVLLAELAPAHPDLAAKTTRIDITRYGHAMAIPVPTSRSLTEPGSGRRGKLTPAQRAVPVAGPLAFAHSDWAGYSIFEEAFTMGHAAGGLVASNFG